LGSWASSLDDVPEQLDGKMDAMIGYATLILVMVTLLAGVISMLKEK
jgi:hypothetical protein